MSDWTATHADGTETVLTDLDTLDEATAAALADAGDREVVSVVLIDPAAAALASALKKLKALGLTEQEARALAGPTAQ